MYMHRAEMYMHRKGRIVRDAFFHSKGRGVGGREGGRGEAEEVRERPSLTWRRGRASTSRALRSRRAREGGREGGKKRKTRAFMVIEQENRFCEKEEEKEEERGRRTKTGHSTCEQAKRSIKLGKNE